MLDQCEEERGRDQWILSDIEHLGGDSLGVCQGIPNRPSRQLICYVFDQIQRINPLTVFGIVYVTQRIMAPLAEHLADDLGGQLGLARQDCSYLYSHSSLDADYFDEFRGALNKVDDPEDQTDIVLAARIASDLWCDTWGYS